jgi:preprotein translocase subunit YajC
VTSALVEAADKSSSSGLGFIFPLLLVAMVGFLFLSTRKRKAASQQMQSALKVGSSIMTTAGLFATVVAIHDDGVVLEVAPGVHSKYARQAISKVLSSPDDGPIEHEAIHEDEHEPSIDLNKEPPSAA